MANKRVIDMQELSELGDGWYTFLDSATGGTKKFDMGNMLNATADAQDAAEAARSAATSAREAADGVVSPTVTPSQITGGTRVTITDVDGTRTFDVMDGLQGEKGDTGDPAAPGSITTDMLADGAITPDKLAPGITDGHHPALVAGSATGILGDPETASWMERTTAADGAALIESVKGNTLRWNQLVDGSAFVGRDTGGITVAYANGKYSIDGTTTGYVEVHFVASFSMTSGHKYLFLTNHDKGNTYGDKFFVYDKKNLQRVAGLESLWSSRIFTADNTYEDCEFDFVQGTAGYEIHDAFTLSIFDLTAMFGAGNEPATVAEFEALFPEPYYPYDAGSLLPVRMEGIETVGFNQWDEEWELGWVDNTGANRESSSNIRSKNYIPVFPNTQYYFKTPRVGVFVYFDADKNCLGNVDANGLRDIPVPGAVRTTPSNCRYVRLWLASGTTYNHDICINLSDPARNGTYEPYWCSERAIPVATYFPDGMRSAGSVRDELRADAAITRVGAVDLGTLTWVASPTATEGRQRFYTNDLTSLAMKASSNDSAADAKAPIYETLSYNALYNGTTNKVLAISISGVVSVVDTAYTDAAAFKTAMSGVMLHYALATPTTTPIDPPLPLSYRTGKGGTERVMVASGTTSAPPIFATRYPLDPADLAASIAPVDGPTAKTNHQVGDLLMLGFTLCKATQVIVTGETIAIGTNVTRTTVAAELAALSE